MINEMYSASQGDRTDIDPSENRSLLKRINTAKEDISPETVKQLCQGNPEAFKAVYMRFYEPLADFLSALIHNEAEGEELAQETMIQLWENREKIDPEGNLSGYIYTIGRNAALQYLRRRKVRVSYANDYVNWGETKSPGDEVILAKETELLIRMKLEQLPEQKRRIYEMHRQEGKSYEEIAGELDISVNTVKYHMKSTLKELRDVITLFLALVLLSR